MTTPQHPSSARACGETVEHPRQRGADGRFLPGNTVARKYGLSPPSRQAAIQETSEHIERFVSAAVARDGASHIPTRRRSLFLYRALIDRRMRQVSDALAMHGLVVRGRVRDTWLQALERLVDLALKIDLLVGWPPAVATVTSQDWTIEELERRVDGETRWAEELKQRYVEEHGQDTRSRLSQSPPPPAPNRRSQAGAMCAHR